MEGCSNGPALVVALQAQRVMQRLLNVVLVIMLAVIAFALWRSARENTSQLHVPLESSKPR